MERIRVQGGHVDGRTTGSGPPVLLIHGSLRADAWDGMMDQPPLRDAYRLITWHRRGYAGSDRAPAGFSLVDQAADAKAVLSYFGEQTAHIVGHSFGGRVALQLTHDHPDSVRTLALLETGGPPVASVAGFLSVIESAVATHEAGDDAAALDTFLRHLGGDDYRKALDAALPAGWPEQTLADIDTFFDIELPARGPFGAEDAAALSPPVLAVVGEHSPEFFQDGFTWLAQHVRNLETFRLPGATHLLQQNNPAGLADCLAGFFARHPTGA